MPNPKTTSKTNKSQGSQQEVKLKVITFDDLWKAYPSKVPKHIDPKTRKDVFDNYCAINLSEALHECGVTFKTFRGARCYACPAPDEKTKKGVHVIRAQELSDYLKTKPFAGCPKPSVFKGSTYEKGVSGKKGIIFFQNYWLRDGEKSPSGDHIDLWNEDELKGSGGMFMRNHLPWIAEHIFSMSDFRKATQVLFWELP